MSSIRPSLLVLAALSVAAGAEAQSPSPTALAELDPGARIRAQGPGIRELIRPSFGEVLQRGLISIVVRPPADGVVAAASPEMLRFTELRRSRLVEVPWSGIDYVDVHRGRSVPVGALEGAGLGALTGLVMWGVIELIFLAADNPVVDDPEVIIGIGAGAGALYGAATLGDRWERVYPAR